jgi:hypothetical protein
VTIASVLPLAFTVVADEIASTLQLQQVKRLGEEQFDRSFATVSTEVTAFVFITWQPRQSVWRARIDMGLRHKRIEDLLDGFFLDHPYHPPSPERLTFRWLFKPDPDTDNPITIASDRDLVSLGDTFRVAATQLRSLADDTREIPALLARAPAVGPNVEVLAVCHYLLGDRSVADQLIREVSEASMSETRRSQMAFLADWLEQQGFEGQ